MARLEDIKRIIELDARLEKLIKRVEELHYFAKHLKKYILCDPYSGDYCPDDDEGFIGKLYEWVSLYNIMIEKEPYKILDLYGISARIDYANLVLDQLCLKDHLFECVDVNVKLPLDDEAKKKILSKIKEKIENMVRNQTTLALADRILAIREILYGLDYEIDQLRKQYNELKQKIEKVIV